MESGQSDIDLVQEAMEVLKLTPDRLADRLGIKARTVKGILYGEFSLSEPVKKHLRSLLELNQLVSPQSGNTKSGETLREATPYFGKVYEIPCLSMAHAGDMTSYEELPKHWQDTIITTCSDPHAFALVLEGECMLPEYRPRDILIVSPSKKPSSGSKVVAKTKSDDILFRIFNITSVDRREFVFSCLNPLYPPMPVTEENIVWMYPLHSALRIEMLK